MVILGFYTLQGKHLAPIIIQFGRVEGTKGPLNCVKFHIDRPYMGISDVKEPKRSQILQIYFPHRVNPLHDIH